MEAAHGRHSVLILHLTIQKTLFLPTKLAVNDIGVLFGVSVTCSEKEGLLAISSGYIVAVKTVRQLTHMANVQAFIQAWQSQGVLSSRPPLEQTMKEPPNALVLAVNMQNLPLKDTSEWVQTATEDEVREHKGLRTSFFIAELLYAGFTFVAPPAGADKSVKGDRLATFDSEEDKRTVIFYTYKGEQNKKLETYVKTKRFEECTSISQGRFSFFLVVISVCMCIS